MSFIFFAFTVHQALGRIEDAGLRLDDLPHNGHARQLPVPGADLAGVHVLRTMADVNAIRARIVSGLRAAVVGAGYIGLECAATFRKLGVEVLLAALLASLAPPAPAAVVDEVVLRRMVGEAVAAAASPLPRFAWVAPSVVS